MFHVLASCILYQYEDIIATRRAMTGHLDGIFKLLQPHLSPANAFQELHRNPESTRALEVVVWYFALNDMVDACSSQMDTTIDYP